MPIVALQHEPAKLVPQRLAVGCLRQSLGDRVGARIAPPRVRAPKREQHRGLVGPRLGARLEVRNRLGIAAELDEHQAEELPRLQQ